MKIYQKQMVYYSEKYAKKQKRERDKAKATSYGCTAYINNIAFSKDTGEIVDGKELSLNEEKIAEETLYDGYYAIVTSEKELPDKEIRDIYKGLWEIEESFKIIKSEFKTRHVILTMEKKFRIDFSKNFRRITYSTKKAGTHLVLWVPAKHANLFYHLITLKYHLIPANSAPLQQRF